MGNGVSIFSEEIPGACGQATESFITDAISEVPKANTLLAVFL
jgi:hypothetical protein